MSNVLSGVTILTLIGTVTAFLGRLGWACELTSHFRVQSLIILAVCTAGLALRQRRMAWVAAAGALTNLCLVVPAYGIGVAPVAQASAGSGRPVRLMISNVYLGSQQYERVQAAIRASDPDLILLMEITKPWLSQLESVRQAYPFHAEYALGGRFGMALYSRLPAETIDVRLLGTMGMVVSTAQLMLDGQLVTILGAHPRAPTTPMYARLRNRQLAELARMAASRTGPLVLAGDMNVSPWSPYFRDLLAQSGLRDSRIGHGIQATWPAFLPVMMIPIDHCLVSPEVTVRSRRVGPGVGSDHYPVIVEFSVSGAEGAPREGG